MGDVLDHMVLAAGHVSCDLCGGQLSWSEDRKLSMVVEAMTDHYATNHAAAHVPEMLRHVTPAETGIYEEAFL